MSAWDNILWIFLFEVAKVVRPNFVVALLAPTVDGVGVGSVFVQVSIAIANCRLELLVN